MSRGDDAVYPGHRFDEDDEPWTHTGLSIREHFAGLAMNGLLSRDAHHVPADIAELARDCADALLADLAGETEGGE